MIAFCVGNGPSLTARDLNFISDNMGNEDVSFASNYIHLIYPDTYWRPNLWVTVETPSFYPLLKHIEEGYRVYLTCNRSDKVEKKRPPFRLVENVSYLPLCEHMWQYKKEGKHPPAQMVFGEKLHPICMYGGSGIVAIQLAILGGFSPIVLVGHDGIYTEGVTHFSAEYKDDDWPAWFTPKIRTDTLVDAHEKLAEAVRLKTGTKIINCTNGGILDMYKRMPLEEFFLCQEPSW